MCVCYFCEHHTILLSLNPPAAAYFLISITIFVTKWMFAIAGPEKAAAHAPTLNYNLESCFIRKTG